MSTPEPIKFKPGPSIDPIEEATSYVHHLWVQVMTPICTRCYRCHKDSPIVHVPYGVMAFSDPKLLRIGNGRKERDITRDTIMAFAAVGWKFQLRRSYCPDCKGLGSVG
jgi:hypothetical protein